MLPALIVLLDPLTICCRNRRRIDEYNQTRKHVARKTSELFNLSAANRQRIEEYNQSRKQVAGKTSELFNEYLQWMSSLLQQYGQGKMINCCRLELLANSTTCFMAILQLTTSMKAR